MAWRRIETKGCIQDQKTPERKVAFRRPLALPVSIFADSSCSSKHSSASINPHEEVDTDAHTGRRISISPQAEVDRDANISRTTSINPQEEVDRDANSGWTTSISLPDRVYREAYTGRTTSINIPEQVDREIYIGRRTSIGSIEREERTNFFIRCDQLRNADIQNEALESLRQMRRHLGSGFRDHLDPRIM